MQQTLIGLAKRCAYARDCLVEAVMKLARSWQIVGKSLSRYFRSASLGQSDSALRILTCYNNNNKVMH